MKIGILVFLTDYSVDVAAYARSMEEMGFESLWVPEHPVLPADKTVFPYSDDGAMPKVYSDIVDPFIALAHASAVTSTLKLGTGICLVPERNPLLLAKEVATLDLYSQGRFLFGIGAGWHRSEIEIMGGDFDHRWTQTRESVLAMKELWTKVESEFHGEHYDFPPVYSFPRPVQRPHPPVLLGGRAANVFRRVVAWGDGWIPAALEPDKISAGRAELARLAEAAGRDPDSISISAVWDRPDRDMIRRFEDAGADRLIVQVATSPEAEALAELEEIAEEAIV